MRTIHLPVQHTVRLHAPVKNPVSDRVLNNLNLLLLEQGPNCNNDLVFRFTNVLRFGMQRFCDCLNLVHQILNMPFLKQFSLTINNYHAIKTC